MPKRRKVVAQGEDGWAAHEGRTLASIFRRLHTVSPSLPHGQPGAGWVGGGRGDWHCQ